MADWRPAVPPEATPRRADGRVRMYRSQTFSLSPGVRQRFPGTGDYLIVFQNGDRHVVGLKRTDRKPGQFSIKFFGVGSSISARRLLRLAGKAYPAETVTIPHRWDGDVLVLDLSGLPDASEAE